MSTAELRLSVPPVRKDLPRALTPTEVSTSRRVADILIHGDDKLGAPSTFQEFPGQLDIALATRSDAFDLFVGLLVEAGRLGETLSEWVRQLHEEEPESFQALSSVMAGAYLLIPAVRLGIGYPGQSRDPAGIEEAVDELSDGIMDPVLERGHFFIPAPDKE